MSSNNLNNSATASLFNINGMWYLTIFMIAWAFWYARGPNWVLVCLFPSGQGPVGLYWCCYDYTHQHPLVLLRETKPVKLMPQKNNEPPPTSSDSLTPSSNPSSSSYNSHKHTIHDNTAHELSSCLPSRASSCVCASRLLVRLYEISPKITQKPRKIPTKRHQNLFNAYRLTYFDPKTSLIFQILQNTSIGR